MVKKQTDRHGQPRKQETIQRARNIRKNKRKINPLYYLFLLLIMPVFITVNQFWLKIDGIPTWTGIYNSANLTETPVVNSDVSVHFIDVGQGDCELIMAHGKTILIDSGELEYSSVVINYLKSQGIEKLDYVVNSHPHSDHAGGLATIMKTFPTTEIIMPKLSEQMIPTTNTYTRMILAINSEGIKLHYAVPGETIQLTDDCRIEIIAPLGDYTELNSCSVVLRFVHGENSFLFTGDIEDDAEHDILDSGADISADVLKVAHHGSSTSSKKKFLAAVGAKYAVIEVGRPNTYNHPNDKVLKRLEEAGYLILRTDNNENIVFESDGYNLSYKCTEETNAHS